MSATQSTLPESAARGAQKPSRLRGILLLGLVAVAVAFALRSSTWAREYQYRRATLEALKTFAAESPKDPLVHYYLGTQYSNSGVLPEALQSFQRASLLDPKMARAQAGVAGVYLRLGQLEPAREAAARAAELDPKSVDARLMLGVIAFPESRTKARLEFERLTRLAPKRADGWHWLGLCSRDLNDPSSALAPLQKAVALEPSNAVYQRDLGKTLLELDRFDQARPHLEKAVTLAPTDAEANYLLGRGIATTARGDEDLKRAEELMRRSIDILGAVEQKDYRNIAAVCVEWADVLRQLKRPKEALAVLQNARKMDAGNIRILHQMALTARVLKMDAQAEAWLTEYSRLSRQQTELNNMVQRVKQDDRNAGLRLRLARMYRDSGNLPFAVNQYEQCLRLSPGQPDATRERAAVLARLNQEMKKRAQAPPQGGPADGTAPQGTEASPGSPAPP